MRPKDRVWAPCIWSQRGGGPVQTEKSSPKHIFHSLRSAEHVPFSGSAPVIHWYAIDQYCTYYLYRLNYVNYLTVKIHNVTCLGEYGIGYKHTDNETTTGNRDERPLGRLWYFSPWYFVIVVFCHLASSFFLSLITLYIFHTWRSYITMEL